MSAAGSGRGGAALPVRTARAFDCAASAEPACRYRRPAAAAVNAARPEARRPLRNVLLACEREQNALCFLLSFLKMTV